MSEEKEHTSNHESRDHWRRGGSIVLVIAIIMLAVTERGWFHQWEMLGVDPLLSSHSYKSQDIWLVEITDEDYRDPKLFNNTSPLNPTLIATIITKLAKAHPAEIVVDLDLPDTITDSGVKTKESPDSRSVLQKQISLSVKPVPIIVWTTMTHGAEAGSGRPILSQPVPSGRDMVLGLPLFPRDRDGVVRGYQRAVDVIDGQRCLSWPTLAWAAYRRGGTEPEPCSGKEKQDEMTYLNFSGDPYTFPTVDISAILDDSGSGIANVLDGKTVILGGAFDSGRDQYFTPVGPRQGMELTAIALESEMQGTVIRPLHAFEVFGVDVGLGFCLVWIGHWRKERLWQAVLFSAFAALALPIVGSYLVFHTYKFALSFLIVALGAFVHIAIDGILDAIRKEGDLRAKEGELQELKSTNEKLEAELKECKSTSIEKNEVSISERIQIINVIGTEKV